MLPILKPFDLLLYHEVVPPVSDGRHSVILTARNYSPTEVKPRFTMLQPNMRFPLNVIM